MSWSSGVKPITPDLILAVLAFSVKGSGRWVLPGCRVEVLGKWDVLPEVAVEVPVPVVPVAVTVVVESVVVVESRPWSVLAMLALIMAAVTPGGNWKETLPGSRGSRLRIVLATSVGAAPAPVTPSYLDTPGR